MVHSSGHCQFAQVKIFQFHVQEVAGNYHRRGSEYFGRCFCQRHYVTTVRDAVTKRYSCVVEIKAEVEDGVV